MDYFHTLFVLKIPPGMPGYSIDVEAFCNEVTSTKTNSTTDSETKQNSTSQPKPSSKPNTDWNLLSQAIDRILFILYLLIILIFLATYVGGIANNEANNPNMYADGFNQ